MNAELLVRDAMTRSIVSVSPDARIDVAIDLMVTKNFNALPVTDSHGRLVGVISDYDVLRLYGGSQPDSKQWEPCKCFMTPDVKTIEHDELLKEAANVFEESGLRRLMVLMDSKLVGILSRRDIVRCIRDQRLRTNDRRLSVLVSQD